MEVRTLLVGEWPLWRQLRLAALAASPDAFRARLEDECWQTGDWREDLIDSTVVHPRGSLWIAEVDSDSVGMVFARIDSDFSPVEIGAMWVSPTVRGRGIGAALLASPLEWTRAHGVRLAELWVTESNTSAESFYEGFGFQPTAETQPLRPGSNLTVRKLHMTV